MKNFLWSKRSISDMEKILKQYKSERSINSKLLQAKQTLSKRKKWFRACLKMIQKNLFKKFKKVIDEFVFYAIMLDSAKIPRQLYQAQYATGGRLGESMSSIIVKENESLDSALRRFKRSCAKAGIQQEIRKREHYEKPSVKRKKKSEAARKRKYK